MDRARRFNRQRDQLVALLREKGITDERVLEAIGAVPRHLFVDQALMRRAYEDEALPIGLSQTISQPFTVAYQTQMLDLAPGDRILEVGTGSGYQAAVLTLLGVQLFSIERLRPLYERTRELLKKLDYRVTCRLGDGSAGWDAMAPFDGIIVTAGAPVVPDALKIQLRIPDADHRGGRLVIPVGQNDGQVMNRFVRTGEDSFEREQTEGFRFVPLISG